MRCRPGDMAVILRDSPTQVFKTGGLFVEVLYRVMPGDHTLPDGSIVTVRAADAWIIKFPTRRPFSTFTKGRFIWSCYTACPDRRLLPIRPGDEDVDLVAELNRPEELVFIDK